MKKFILFMVLLLFPFLSFATTGQIRSVVMMAKTASSEWIIDDDFSSDTSGNFTIIHQEIDGVQYDATNDRLLGESNVWWSSAAYHSTTMGSANHQVEAKILYNGTSGNTAALLFRCDGNGASAVGWIVRPSGSGLHLLTFSGSTVTYVTGISFTGGKTWASAASYRVRIGVTGSTLSLYVDWNDDGDFDDTDETLTTSYSIAGTPTGNYIGLSFLQSGTAAWADNLRAKSL